MSFVKGIPAFVSCASAARQFGQVTRAKSRISAGFSTAGATGVSSPTGAGSALGASAAMIAGADSGVNALRETL